MQISLGTCNTVINTPELMSTYEANVTSDYGLIVRNDKDICILIFKCVTLWENFDIKLEIEVTALIVDLNDDPYVKIHVSLFFISLLIKNVG